jgi:DNA-binding winged helix-turn-helix (wHTH) protein
MSRRAKQLYEFGPFSIDVTERMLFRAGQVVPLTPKTFDLLLVLVENSRHLIEKDELMQRLWPDTLVEEANLPNNISLLRKALGDDTSEPQYIETVPRRGYRFVARVVEPSTEPTELIVEERTRATLTLEHESKDDLQQASVFPARSTAKRPTIWFIAALAMLAALAAAVYYFRDQSKVTPAPISR